MRGRPWTGEDKAQLRRLVASGKTAAQIGEIMDRHERLIREKCKLHQFTLGYSPALKAMMARINMRRRMMVRA